jgi:hypothetical protein
MRPWTPNDYWLSGSADGLETTAIEAYQQVCRCDFTAPGFAVIDLGQIESTNLRRVINSTMIASVPLGTADSVSAAELDAFATINLVRRRGYDKPTTADDQ